MELIITTGVPIVCFIFGYFLGYRGAIELLGASVSAGFNVGQETLLKQLMATGQLSTGLLETSQSGDTGDIQSGESDSTEKMSFGFDLSTKEKDKRDE